MAVTAVTVCRKSASPWEYREHQGQHGCRKSQYRQIGNRVGSRFQQIQAIAGSGNPAGSVRQLLPAGGPAAKADGLLQSPQGIQHQAVHAGETGPHLHTGTCAPSAQCQRDDSADHQIGGQRQHACQRMLQSDKDHHHAAGEQGNGDR